MLGMAVATIVASSATMAVEAMMDATTRARWVVGTVLVNCFGGFGYATSITVPVGFVLLITPATGSYLM